MAGLHTGQWIKFFQQAGIPDKAAATYALTFAENRIQMNMLLDLNKEYLRDMGITLMGDVIAILRHARAKHDEIAREKLLVTNNRDKPVVSSKAVEVVPITISKPTIPVKKPPPSQTVDHCTREGLSAVSPTKPKVPGKEPKPHNGSINLQKSLAAQPEAAVPVKRKSKPSMSSLELITIEDDTPPKKARRVSPEEEGGYKIKMPSGTTPRSQQILAKSKELAVRKTVFQRLGSGTTTSSPNGTRSPPSASAVSSTTGVNTPSFTVTGLSSAVLDAAVTKKISSGLSSPVTKKVVKPEAPLPSRSQTSSVFRRLGDKQVSSSTQKVARRDEALPYAGILKSTEKFTQRIVQKPFETVTMVADSVETMRTEIRERLGTVLKASSVEFAPKVERRKKSRPDLSKAGIKSRLGGTKLVSDNSEGESSVKERLKMAPVKSYARTTPYSVNISSEINKQKGRGVFSRLGS